MSAPGLAAHLSPAELGQRYRAARSPIERSHLQIVWLLSQGRDEREVARVTGYGRRWVGEIVRRYDEAGPDGLGDRRRGNAGARPLLGAEDEAALRAALAAPPADGGLWTGPKVAAWMGVRLGREVWPQRGWDYLKKLGYSAQVPRPRHAKAASAEEQAAYKKSSPRWCGSAVSSSPDGRSRSGPSTSTGSG
jgi:transposase